MRTARVALTPRDPDGVLKDEIMMAVADRFERRVVESMSELRREIHEGRVELFKWTIVMWITEMALLVTVLFRTR